MVNINSGFKVTCDIIVAGNTMLLAAIIMHFSSMRDVTTVTIRVNIEYVET